MKAVSQIRPRVAMAWGNGMMERSGACRHRRWTRRLRKVLSTFPDLSRSEIEEMSVFVSRVDTLERKGEDSPAELAIGQARLTDFLFSGYCLAIRWSADSHDDRTMQNDKFKGASQRTECVEPSGQTFRWRLSSDFVLRYAAPARPTWRDRE